MGINLLRVTRLSGEARRTAILEAAVPLFAAKGFHGVRTRELAEAAGVSEALLYKHFPSKEALYAELLHHVHRADEEPELQAMLALPPGTEKFVKAVRFLTRHLVARTDDMTLARLLTTSLLEDGAFARATYARFQREHFPDLLAAYRAARAAGDVHPGVDLPGDLPVWLCQHVAFACRVLALPGEVVDYGVSRATLAEQVAEFALRGVGLREEALRAHRVSAPDRRTKRPRGKRRARERT